MKWWVYAIGFLAQGFFSARILIQWIKSERLQRVVSPTSYWVCSLAGSWLLFFYGWLRTDFAVICGQLLTYYIYIWNLNAKGVYSSIPRVVRWVLLATPVAAIALIGWDWEAFMESFLQNEQIPLWLVIFGTTGQVVFALRFLYQWYYSYKRNRSILPRGFWVMSLTGSGIILIYAAIRLDPVLIVGQAFGFVAYFRNLVIGGKEKKPL